MSYHRVYHDRHFGSRYAHASVCGCIGVFVLFIISAILVFIFGGVQLSNVYLRGEE